eukprot:10382110-Ditylum_brightwellii.AAC.1
MARLCYPQFHAKYDDFFESVQTREYPGKSLSKWKNLAGLEQLREQLPRMISTCRSRRGPSTLLEAQQIRPHQVSRDVLNEDPRSDSLKDSASLPEDHESVLIETGSG